MPISIREVSAASPPMMLTASNEYASGTNTWSSPAASRATTRSNVARTVPS